MSKRYVRVKPGKGIVTVGAQVLVERKLYELDDSSAVVDALASDDIEELEPVTVAGTPAPTPLDVATQQELDALAANAATDPELATLAAALSAHQADSFAHSGNVEADYAERAASHASASLAAGAAEDIPALAISFVADGRPFMLSLDSYVVQPGTANARPELLITDMLNNVVARKRWSAASAILQPTPLVTRRLQPAAGTQCDYKARIGNGTGGTASAITVNAVADAPMRLDAVYR